MSQSFWQDFWTHMKHVESAYDLCRRKIMNRFHLSAIEVDVLLFLANNEKYDTASDISSIRKIPKSHVSLAVNLLSQKKYIRKETDPLNKRKKHLVITKDASEIVQYGKKQQEIFTKSLLDGFSMNELKQLDECFKRMTGNLLEYEKNTFDGEE